VRLKWHRSVRSGASPEPDERLPRTIRVQASSTIVGHSNLVPMNYCVDRVTKPCYDSL
jgi:hypothetical protein